jgi:tetratricopeptide (TPR) repeat protein
MVQLETGDYPAATASLQQALALHHQVGNQLCQAWALEGLGRVQQLTGDYTAAAASLQQALQLHRDLGCRAGEAEALNSLGQLATRTVASHRARGYHSRALAIAQNLRAPWKKHAPWKESAKATYRTTTPAKPPCTYSRHSRSTSASGLPPHDECRKPSTTTS